MAIVQHYLKWSQTDRQTDRSNIHTGTCQIYQWRRKKCHWHNPSTCSTLSGQSSRHHPTAWPGDSGEFPFRVTSERLPGYPPAGTHSSHSTIHSGHSSRSSNTQKPHISGSTFEMHLGSPKEPQTCLSHQKKGVKTTFLGHEVQFFLGLSFALRSLDQFHWPHWSSLPPPAPPPNFFRILFWTFLILFVDPF